MLILWPIDFVVARLRYRNADAEVDILETSKAAHAARLMAFLTLLSFLLVIILYVIYMSNHPNSGELSWPGGSVLVKILIVIANISVFLAILLIIIAFLAWKNKYWNIAWQIHYTLVAIAILSATYIWKELGFLGWG